MKKLMFLGISVLILASCHNYKKDAERLTMQKDSLQREANVKDSSILTYLSEFNEIQANLDSIKKIEDLVTVESTGSNELKSSQKQKILDDINLLKDLLQKNKDLVASLRKKLNSSNSQIGKLNSTIAELQQMVENMEKRIQEKDAEIASLSDQVQKLNVDISSLNQRITAAEEQNQQKSETIENQTMELNTAYYAYGTTRELKDNGVIEKTGGFLGIGRTPEIKDDFNRDYFTKVDIRNFNYLPLMVKKAKVVSVHPAGSFHISGEGTADTLFIDNKAEFWKVSKYLVVLAQ